MNVQKPPAGWWRLDADAAEEGEEQQEETVKGEHSQEQAAEGDKERKEECKEEEKEPNEEEEEEEGEEEEDSAEPKAIRKEELNIGKKVAFILYNVLSPAECQHLIATTERMGYKPMPDYPIGYRSNTRLIIDDDELQQEVWRRVAPHIPATFEDRRGKWEAYGLNPRWRFCRYCIFIFIFKYVS